MVQHIGTLPSFQRSLPSQGTSKGENEGYVTQYQFTAA